MSVKPEFENNEFSNRYVDIDGDSLSVTSSGTRLFLGILAALMDERFRVVALDEPELGLSPMLQSKLTPIIIDRGSRRAAIPAQPSLLPHDPFSCVSGQTKSDEQLRCVEEWKHNPRETGRRLATANRHPIQDAWQRPRQLSRLRPERCS
jgi:hypothetical protein